MLCKSVYTNYMTNYMCIIVLHQIAAYTFCNLGWDAMPPETTDHTTIFQININSYFPLPMLQPSSRWLIPFYSEATFCHCGFFKQHRLQGMQLHYRDSSAKIEISFIYYSPQSWWRLVAFLSPPNKFLSSM